MTTYIPTASKAIAAFVTPFIVAGLAWLIEATGVEVPYDPRLIETFLVAAFTAGATWAISNRPAPDGGARDRGQSFVQVLIAVALILAIIALAVWLHGRLG